MMNDDIKEEIRDRLDIEDVVADYIELRRAGRNFKALSPFSNEKTPSFVVSPDKRIWHDFSSGKGGDVFSFVMEMEGVDFREALKILARKAGVELKQYNSEKSVELAKRKQLIYKLNHLTGRFFEAILAKNQHALDYAQKNRQLNTQTIKSFMIGYAPNNGKALVDFLTKRGFSHQQLAEAGLVNQYGGDLFKQRLIIPLTDAMGQVIGFTGRGLSPDSIPKYLNTPSTLIYDKSRHVFGLYQAKEAIRKLNQVVIVEGNMDVISSHQAGFMNVVATAGTAMTTHHLKILNRYSSDIRLAFDADQAGLKAAERAIELAQTVGVDIKIISLIGQVKDPDELIKQDPKLWQQSIDQAEPAVDWLMKVYQQQFDLKTALGKRDYAKAILKTVSKLNNQVEKEAYLQKIADQLTISIEIIKTQLDRAKETKSVKKTRLSIKNKLSFDQTKYQDDLLAMAMISQKIRQQFAELDLTMFCNLPDKPRQQLAQILSAHIDNFDKKLLANLQDLTIYAKVLTLKTEEHYLSWPKNDLAKEGRRLISRLRQDFDQQGKDKLMEQLKQAELIGDEAQAEQILAKINQITKGDHK